MPFSNLAVDLSAVDKFNATPWDYAKNRQLHYCQLIIMSHQRQRLVSNPASPIPTGLGLMLNGFGGSFMSGDFNGSIDFDNMVGSVYIIEPPHDKTNKMACAPSKDSDQLRHPPSLISLRCSHEESLGP